MKRLLVILLAAALVLPLGTALGKQAPSGNSNYRLQQGDGAEPLQPYRDIRLVRTGNLGTTLIGRKTSRFAIFSGEAVIWDTNSGDGITVTFVDQTSQDRRFAGIAVASFETDDVNGIAGENGGGANWAYIVTRGWALASVDSTGGPGYNYGLHTSGTHQGALTFTTISGDGITSGFVQSDDAVAIPLTATVGGQHTPVMIR